MTEQQTWPNGRAMRSGRLAAGLAIALAMAVGLRAHPVAAEVATAACDTLSLAIEGTGAVQVCEAGGYVVPGGDGPPIRVGVEAIAATGESSWLIVISYTIRSRAYLKRWSPEAFIDDHHWFAAVRNWGAEYELGDFDAVPFEARLDGPGGFRHCVGFVRYIGHVPHSFGGARRSIGGAYCKDQPDGLSAEEMRGVLDRIRF